MSYNSLQVNGAISASVAGMLNATPALNDVVKVSDGALISGASEQVKEYAIASVGSTGTGSTATISDFYTASGAGLTSLYNHPARSPGGRLNLFNSGAVVETVSTGTAYRTFWIETPNAEGWYLLSATVSTRGLIGFVGFRWGDDSPEIRVAVAPTNTNMSRTARAVKYITGTTRLYLKVTTARLNTANDHRVADSAKAAGVSIDVTRIG